LHFLARQHPHAAVLIIGTLRSEEIGPHHPLATLRYGLQSNQQ